MQRTKVRRFIQTRLPHFVHQQLISVLSENCSSSFAVLNPNAEYVIASKRHIIDFHLNEDSLIGFSIFDVFPDYKDDWAQIINQSKSRKVPQIVEKVFQHPDGREEMIRWKIIPLFTEHHIWVGCVLVSDIITEQSQVETRLEKAVKELSVVNAAAQRLQTLISPELLSQEIISVLESFLDYTYCGVLLIDEADGETLQPFALSMQKLGKQFLEQDKKYVSSKNPRVGVGITGWVAQHGKSLRIGNVLEDSRYFSMRSDIHSELCVPLFLEGRVFGVINIETTEENAYSNDDQIVLETIAAQISVSIQNAILFEKYRMRVRDLETIQSIGLGLASSLNSTELLHMFLQNILILFSATYAVFMKAAVETNTFTIAEFVGSLPAFWYPEDIFIIEAGDPEIIDIGNRCEEGRGTGARCHLLHSHPDGAVNSSAMATPIRLDNEITSNLNYGFLLVGKMEAGAYSGNDLKLLQSLTSVLAVMMQNANLYEDLQQTLIEYEQTRSLLIQSEKIAALGRLASSMAHEINNPLQSIKGCMSLFHEELEHGREKRILNQYINLVDGEVDRIARLTHSMQEVYTPSLKTLVPVDLNKIIENILILVNKPISTNNIKVEVLSIENLPIIIGNPDHFKQLFLNIILNAIDAMSSGGTLSISTRLLSEKNQPVVEVQISDTGTGMDQDVLDHLFEPFRTTKENGSGLGLYISQDIVKSYGGKIDVISQMNAGTTFKIQLPLRQDNHNL